MFNVIRRYKRLLVRAHDALVDIRSAAIRRECRELRDAAAAVSSKHLLPFGFKVYSQTDEDGILAEIFRRVGTTSRVFVEFGIGNGLENNTLALMFDGWRGLWIEQSGKAFDAIGRHWSALIANGTLTIVRSVVTVDNIDHLLSQNLEADEIDLLSVDIDGNDWHVVKAISAVSARVVVLEYNAKFVPPIRYCMRYDSAYTWQGTDRHGASLQYLADGMSEKGYSLVGCNISGANAFFVRSDLVADKFMEPFTAMRHYQPARYHLTRDSSGHPASYATLASAQTSDSEYADGGPGGSSVDDRAVRAPRT